MRVGVDTGGTFTDLVTDDGRIAKVPSTPDDPGDAVRRVTGAISATPPEVLAHGTTVATNALLERTVGRVALVTNRGFADVIEIARQARPSLYDAHVDRPPALVDRALRFEVGGRLDAEGRELEPFDGRVPDIDGADAVAVCLLHADLDARHEHAVAAVLAGRGLDTTLSSDVSPEFREYERLVTTVVNAALRPVCRSYLHGLDDVARETLVMTSAGGLIPVATAAELPVTLLLSGPAGGVRAAAVVAAACGYPLAVSFDMGGTSTDVCLVRGGVPEPSPTRTVAGYPIRMPALAVHTIGAGGGSIARLDAGGALVVGSRERRRGAGPRVLRKGRDATDGHRRRPRARPHRCRHQVRRARPARRQRRARRARPCGCDGRRCGRGRRRGDGARGARWSRSSRVSTRGSSRSSRSAVPARCTRARWPTRSVSAR